MTNNRLICNIYIQFRQLNIKKINSIKKWAEELNRCFSQEDCRWTSTWKDAQHRQSSGKCKSKLQWDITSHLSEWPSSKSLHTINAAKGLEKRGHSYTVQFSSVAQLCPTLCDPMNRSTPGLPVHHQLLEFTQTRVHRLSDVIQPSHPLSVGM